MTATRAKKDTRYCCFGFNFFLKLEAYFYCGTLAPSTNTANVQRADKDTGLCVKMNS